MKMRSFSQVLLLTLAILFAFVSRPALAEKKRPPARAGSQASSPGSKVVPDLAQRAARWKTVAMPFPWQGLSTRDLQLMDKLVEASYYLENIYWRQSDPDGLRLYLSLDGATQPQDVLLRRFLMINGSRYDLLDENRPFAGSEPYLPGRGFYPPGLTQPQIEQYLKAHPQQRAAIYSPYTVIRREKGGLKAVPYHVEWAGLLAQAAKALRDASTFSDDPQFAGFLRLRADALLTDDYYQSDLAWMDLKNPKFDVIFAPYETYLDDLLGVKASYGGAVLIRNQEESAKLKLYEQYVPEIQEALPLAKQDLPSKRGLLTPMEVMDTPFRAGELRHGYQAVADNLPNDPRIHEKKGSKKIFFKNYMDARVENVILPLSKRVMLPEQAARVSADGYLASTILHEICHGLGPAFARVNGRQVDIREAIGPAFSGLEEAKADVVGMFGLKWLIDHGALPQDRLQEFYASYVAGLFRTARFGIGEAHGRGEIMEFNYLSEQKAITYDAATKRYTVDFARMPEALASLAKELLEMEATGDRARTESWFKKYNVMPADLAAALAASSELAVDIDPVFSFPEPIE